MSKKSRSSKKIVSKQVSLEKEEIEKIEEDSQLEELFLQLEQEGTIGEDLFFENKKKIRVYSIRWQFIFIFVLLLLVVISLWVAKQYAPNIILYKESKIILDYQEEYKEPGYRLTINAKDYSEKVRVRGKVNPKKLGKYIIEYSYQKGFFKTVKKRIVYVKDLTKPAIILNGSKEVYICPNEEYQEEGYQVVDNYDQDLTSKVKVKKKKDAYVYSVSDQAKNKTTLTRKIIKKDIVRPTIQLKNGDSINIVIGTPYQEEGYTVTDNCDKDIASKVKIEGNVDHNTLGTYTLTYSVSDHANNETKVVRTVHVVKKSMPGTIYLTFDDGPKAGTTDKILDILKEENVKATFFVTNSGPDDLIKRTYDEGHSIGLHTATHDYSQIYQSEENYFNDLKQVQDRVFRITGYRSMLIRFPGGSSNTISRKYKTGIMTSLTKKVLEQGYRYYDWNLASGDAGVVKTPEGVYQIVTSNLSHDRMNVVLMHDIKSYTRDSLRQIIQYAKSNGYTFDVIDQNTEIIAQNVNN